MVAKAVFILFQNKRAVSSAEELANTQQWPRYIVDTNKCFLAYDNYHVNIKHVAGRYRQTLFLIV